MILLELDPNLVKPGWTPLIITLLLGVAVVLLFLSMRRQFGKISIPRTDEGDEADEADDAPTPATPTPDAPTREDPPAS
jgi:hypothetical protein